MEDQKPPFTATIVADPAEAVAPAGPLSLPYEEGCKKIRELALRQLNRFMSYEAKVLKGDDADAIHDMRVASRRLQQVLDLLYPKPRHPELRRLRRQIRRCRQALGEVRNCDVLLEHVELALGRKRSARREAWTAVQHFLRVSRSECFLRALRKLGKINLAVFYVNLKDFFHHDKVLDHAHGQSPATFAQDLNKALEAAWSGFEHHIADSHRDSRPEVIHGARIATKRLRYLLEVFHELGVEGSAEALGWLRQLQNQLGDWHDLEVLEQKMVEMVARPEYLRDHLPMAMEVEKLILRNRKSKGTLEDQYRQMSRESGDLRKLKEWVSYLLASPSAPLARA